MIKKKHRFFKSLIKEAFDERPNKSPGENLADIEKKEPTWELPPVIVSDNVGPPIDDLIADDEVPINSSLKTKGSTKAEREKMNSNVRQAEAMIRSEVRNLLDEIIPSKKTLKENVLKLARKFNLSSEDARIIYEHPQIINDTPHFKKYLASR
jgi:hypothetical protein